MNLFVHALRDAIIRTDQGDIDLERLLAALNRRIEYLYDRDHQIGHAYFMKLDSYVELEKVFLKRIIPLLQEYFYEDWEKIQIVLADLEPDGRGEESAVRENAIIKCQNLASDSYLTSMTESHLLGKRLYIVPDAIPPASIRKIYEE